MTKKAQIPAPKTATERPYYLQRAHIKDFRSLRDAEVDFKPGINIIIGPNGSGKTNFVQCIPDVQENIAQAEGDYSFIFSNSIDIKIDYRYSYLNQEDNSFFIHTTDNTRIFEVSANNISKTDTSIRTAFLALRDELKIGNHYFKSIKLEYNVPVPYYLVSNPVDFTSRQRSFGWNSSGSDTFSRSIINSFANYFIFNEKHINNKEIGDISWAHQIIKNIESIISNLLLPSLQKYTLIQNIRFSPSFFIYYNSMQSEYIIKNIILDFKIHEDWLPFSALSSGTQRLFYIISNVLSTREHYPTGVNPASETTDKIILLEEPELGIHPDQLNLLLQFLREQSKKHQLIITTHSPQVLDMLEEDELDRITICELHKTKGTQFRKLKKTQIETARRFMREKGLFLSDYWRYGSLEKPNKATR